MRRNAFTILFVAIAVAAVAAPAAARDVGRSEVAPGMPAPPDGGGGGSSPDAAWPGPDGYGYSQQ